MKRILFFLAFLTVMPGLISQAAAQVYFNQNPGQPIYGSPLTNADLTGKVVYLEYWGIHCGPCRAAFPHLVECQAMFGKTGSFVMIGSHLQELSPEVTEFLQTQNCNFTNYQQYVCPLAPPQGGGIPQAFLLDARGQLAASGHPAEVLPKVAPLVEEAIARNRLANGFNPILDLEVPKSLQKLAVQFTAEKSWSAPMKQLQKKAAKNEDAQTLLAGIEGAIDAELEALEAQRKEKPAETLYRLERLSKNLKGMPQLEKVDGLKKKVAKRKGAQEMLKVWSQMEAFQKKCRTGKMNPTAAKKEAKKILKSLKELAQEEDFHESVRQEASALAEKLENQLG